MTTATGTSAKIQMITASHGEVQTAVSGRGPAILALHGAMGGFDQGLLLAETVLQPRFKVVAISRPGYLKTPLSVGPTAQEQADLCAEVLDQIEVEKVVVIAISGGGPAALQFVLRHADRCCGLVMISACSARLKEPAPFRWQLMKLAARIPGIVERMRKRVEQHPSKALERAVRDAALRDRLIRDKETAELMLRLQTGVLSGMLKRIPGTDNDIRITRGDMAWPIEKINVPVLAVHGTTDSVVPYKQAESLSRRVPGAQLLSIEGGEHASIFTHRAIVKARIEAFLGSIAGYGREEILKPELVIRSDSRIA